MNKDEYMPLFINGEIILLDTSTIKKAKILAKNEKKSLKTYLNDVYNTANHLLIKDKN